MVALQVFYIDQIFELYKIAQSVSYDRHVWYNNMVEIENLVGKRIWRICSIANQIIG